MIKPYGNARFYILYLFDKSKLNPHEIIFLKGNIPLC